MKKLMTVLFVLALVFTFSNANAQMGFGLLGGINLASMYGDDVDMEGGPDAESIMGIAGGGFLNAPLGDGSLSFRVEALYSQQGTKWEEGDESMTYKVAYIGVPLLLKYSIPTQGSINPFILAGGYLAMLMSAEMEWDVTGFEDTQDVKDDTKSMDYGIMFGAGVLINDLIEVSVRYVMGLTTVDDTDDAWDMKNKMIQILAGINL